MSRLEDICNEEGTRCFDSVGVRLIVVTIQNFYMGQTPTVLEKKITSTTNYTCNRSKCVCTSLVIVIIFSRRWIPLLFSSSIMLLLPNLSIMAHSYSITTFEGLPIARRFSTGRLHIFISHTGTWLAEAGRTLKEPAARRVLLT